MISEERKCQQGRDYLEKYRRAQADLYNAELVFQEAQSIITSIKFPENDKVQESIKYHDLSTLIVRLDEAWQRYLSTAVVAISVMEEVFDTINQVSDDEGRRILAEIYIKNRKQDEIGTNIGMARNTIWRYHKSALLEVWEIIQKKQIWNTMEHNGTSKGDIV